MGVRIYSLVAAICIILVIISVAEGDGPPADGGRLIWDHSEYENVLTGCSYQGYDPYFSTTISSMTHVTASLELDAIDTAFVSSKMAIAYGVLGAGQELMDGSNEILHRWRDMKKRKRDLVTKSLSKWMTQHRDVGKKVVARGLKFAARALTVMSLVLGVFVAAMEAATAVKTPTHEDILGETTKALRKITDDVDRKMAEAMRHAGEQKVMLEKDFYSRRYSYLFTYWTECSKLVQGEHSCQRDAYRQIVSSLDEFLLFHDYLLPGTATFKGLDNDKRRRIEVNMVSFRNYAMLSLLSLNTLASTFDMERQIDKDKDTDSNGHTFESCSEMKLKELEIRQDAGDKNDISIIENYSPPVKLNVFCTFKEELVSKARYFERYGYAAVEEILEVAKSRVDLNSFETSDIKTPIKVERTSREDNSARFTSSISWSGYDYLETRVACKAQLHPSKGNQKCTYDIEMVETPALATRFDSWRSAEEKEGWAERMQDKIKVSDNVWETTGFSAEYYGQISAARACKNLITRRKNEYRKREEWDIRRYWSQEVLKVVKCGKLLAEDIEENCDEANLKKHIPEAFEQVIKIVDAAGNGIKHPERAADGLLSSRTSRPDNGKVKNPSWEGTLKDKVRITELQIFIDGYTGSHIDATVDGIKIDDGTTVQPSSLYRLNDGNFLFVFIDTRSDWGKGYRRLVFTDNNGKMIRNVYMSEYNYNYYGFYKESKWTLAQDDYPVKLINFQGGYPGRFSNLRVEFGTKGDDPVPEDAEIKWTLCKELNGLHPPYRSSQPLSVTCDSVDPSVSRPVEFVKLTVTDSTPKELMLAEVVVRGIPPEPKPAPDPELMVVEFKGATQSSTTTNPFMAIDTLVTTMSSTDEEDGSNWWKGELDTESAIKVVTVDLYGTYKSIKVEVSVDGNDQGPWTQCGDVGENVKGDDSVEGFGRKCDGLTEPVKFVRITGSNESGSGKKSILKIREVVVFGPFVDSSDDGTQIEELFKEQPEIRKKRKKMQTNKKVRGLRKTKTN